MKWRSLTILEETTEGCAIGYADGLGGVDFAAVINPTQTGVNAGIDARANAEQIVRIVNNYSSFVDALESAEISLKEAIAISETVPGCDTRRWRSASDQVRAALQRAKEIKALGERAL